MTETQMSRGELLIAESTFGVLSGFSFQNQRAKHGIRENLTVLTPMGRLIKQSLYEIRNKYIELDGEDKRKRVDGTDDWMWKPGGEAESIREQGEFLSDIVNVPFYTIKENWLEPVWRYVTDKSAEASEKLTVREPYFFTIDDLKHIQYAIKFNEFIDESGEEKLCQDLDSD